MPGAGALTAVLAVTAQELGDLGLERGLHHQPHAETSDVLKDLAELAIGVGEQRVDLGSDTVSGRYSLGWHGRTSWSSG